MASRFGRFELLERIGTGGAGEVLLVRDGERRLALKRLLPHLEDAASAATLEREAALAETLRHEHIVATLEHGRVGDERWVLMEYVDGPSLHRLLRAADRLPAVAAAYAVASVCRALACVHASGMLHRDVSPSNVLVARDGTVKLCDFGIAKMLGGTATRTRPGFVKGKAGYHAPELRRGDALDARGEVYAAGVVLFEALTGRRPQAGDRPSRLVRGLPDAIDAACAQALATSPEERFATAEAMADALAAAAGAEGDALDGRAQLVAAVARWFPPRAPVGQDPTVTLARNGGARRWLLAGAVVTVAAAGVVALLAIRSARRAPHTQVSPALTTAAAAPRTGDPGDPRDPPTPPAPPTVPPAVAPVAPPTTHARKPEHAKSAAKPTRRAAPSGAPKKRDYMPDPFPR